MNSRFSHNFSDLRVGDKIWMFYTFSNTKPEMAEGIFDGEIMEFCGNSLNWAIVYNRPLDLSIKIRINQINRI